MLRHKSGKEHGKNELQKSASGVQACAVFYNGLGSALCFGGLMFVKYLKR